MLTKTPEQPNRRGPDGFYQFEYNPNSCFVEDPDRLHLGGNSKGGDPHGQSLELVDWLIAQYEPQTFLDVGCGTGWMLRKMDAAGLVVAGVEGLEVNAKVCYPFPVLVHDLCDGPVKFAGIDLAWSQEVAEHIDQKYTANFLDTLCVGNVIAMTACPPKCGGGWHHVNEQPAEYWIDLLSKRGYAFDALATEEARAVIADGDNYFRKHGLIFERKDKP